MKTPLLAFLLLAPLSPVALGRDASDCPSAPLASAAAAPVFAEKSGKKSTEPPRAPAPRKEKPRPAPRPPAHLFM